MLPHNPPPRHAVLGITSTNDDRYGGAVMKLRMGTLAALVAAVALAAGCGSSSSTTGSNGGGTPTTTVRSTPNSQLGTNALVNKTGMTLYTLSAERGGRFI